MGVLLNDEQLLVGNLLVLHPNSHPVSHREVRMTPIESLHEGEE